MRTIAVLVAFLAMLSGCSAKTQADADVAAALVGTWSDDPSDNEPTHCRVTYNADGTGFELVWPAGQPESGAVRVDLRWSVTNRVLVLMSVKSSDPEQVPVGLELRDRIVSISAEQFVYEPEAGYGDIEKKRHTMVRVKARSNKNAARNSRPAGQLIRSEIPTSSFQSTLSHGGCA